MLRCYAALEAAAPEYMPFIKMLCNYANLSITSIVDFFGSVIHHHVTRFSGGGRRRLPDPRLADTKQEGPRRGRRRSQSSRFHMLQAN